MERLTLREIDELLSQLSPRAADHADAILDLRELLRDGGHPGKCVRCFFTIAQSLADTPDHGVEALRKWLERNVELTVSAGAKLLETIPFRPQPDADLETYCRITIRSIRLDRSYSHPAITIRFRYRQAA
jgi:hypothetical protein